MYWNAGMTWNTRMYYLSAGMMWNTRIYWNAGMKWNAKMKFSGQMSSLVSLELMWQFSEPPHPSGNLTALFPRMRRLNTTVK